MEHHVSSASSSSQEDLAHLLDINYPTDYPIPVDDLEPEEEPVTDEEAAGPARTKVTMVTKFLTWSQQSKL